MTNDIYIRTASGQRVTLPQPRPEEITLSDIANGLAAMPRFCGQTVWKQHPYSVAQHSLMVLQAVEHYGGSLQSMRYAILHDASEAYLCDLSSPVKLFCPDYKSMERFMMETILEHFAVVPDHRTQELVVAADRDVLLTEARDLCDSHMFSDCQAWYPEAMPLSDKITVLSPAEARAEYIAAAERLGLA